MVISEVRKQNDGVCNWKFKHRYVAGALSNNVIPAKITHQIFQYWLTLSCLKIQNDMQKIIDLIILAV